MEKLKHRSPGETLQMYMDAGRPLIYINHFDFEAVDRMIARACEKYKRRGYNIVEFSEASGWVDFNTKNTHHSSVTDLADFLQRLNTDQLKEETKELIVVLKEIHESIGEKKVYSTLQMIARRKSMADEENCFYRVTVIIVDSRLRIPLEIEKLITVVEIHPPDESEIKQLLISLAGDESAIDADALGDLTMALSGLSEFEITQIAKLALADDGVLDRNDLNLIFEEKRQAILKSGLLEMVETAGKVDLGDFDKLVTYLKNKAYIFNNLADARAHGVDSPSGIMLVGMPGCGKSLSASCVAKTFKCPLLKLDIGRLLGKYVGESEDNLRRAIQVAEAASPCVLWIDEIEKAFSGVNGGEVMTRMFGYFLTWMQEKTAPVYVLATANNISNLPPEFTRRGRFDEIFAVYLPKDNGIGKIFEIHLKKRNGGILPPNIDLEALSKACEGKFYSGADIASIVKSAAEKAYLGEDNNSQPRAITQKDLHELIQDTKSGCMTQRENPQFKKMIAALSDLKAEPVSPTGGEALKELKKLVG